MNLCRLLACAAAFAAVISTSGMAIASAPQLTKAYNVNVQWSADNGSATTVYMGGGKWVEATRNSRLVFDKKRGCMKLRLLPGQVVVSGQVGYVNRRIGRTFNPRVWNGKGCVPMWRIYRLKAGLRLAKLDFVRVSVYTPNRPDPARFTGPDNMMVE